MLTARESLVLEILAQKLRRGPEDRAMREHFEALRPWLGPGVIIPMELLADISAATTRDRLRQLEHARSLAKL
jgi:hypothetical protein